MALPPLSIKITADATNAKAGLKEVSAATKAADMAAEQYQSSLRKVDAAQKSGLISQKAAASATMQAEAAYESATRAAAALTGAQITVGRAANVAGAQIKSATGHTANLGAQFNDIGVMLAAGQSPLMLAMQQGTQINQVMAQMGGGKTALRGLGAAFLGIINPMSLATIGIIAGGAALVQWGMKAFGASEEAKKMAEQVEALADAVEDAEERLRAARMGTSSAEQTAIQELADKTAEILAMRERMNGATATGVALGENAIRVLEEEQAVLRANLDTIQRANTHVALYEAGLTDATIQAMELAGVDLSGEISKAVIEAASLAQLLGVSVDAARQIKFAQATFREGSGRSAGRGGARPGEFNPSQAVIDEADALLNPSAAGGGGGGGSDARAGQIDALVNSLQTERETIADWYAESQAMLANASQAQLDEIGGKQAAIERLEKEHQDRLMGIRADGENSTLTQAGQFFGDMANATRGGNEEMLKISKAFGAAQALISAWQGAAEALKLPFPANIAAFASVLSQGLGAVSAIQSISAGGGGGGGGGGAASAAPVAAAQSITRTVDVNLSGGSESSQGSIRGLIAQINDAIGDGATLNVRGMA
jgi:hypothetical protein